CPPAARGGPHAGAGSCPKKAGTLRQPVLEQSVTERTAVRGRDSHWSSSGTA
ncbi:unnamed protein product, partial [Bubo scandiacus]